VFPGFHARGIKVDVYESLLDRSVLDNWRVLAGFALITIVARYEAWLDDVVALAPASARMVSAPQACRPKKKPVAQGLQFPRLQKDPPRWTPGLADALKTLGDMHDPRLRRSLTPMLHRSYKTDPHHLEPLLTVYRYFTEIRNSLAHSDGRASQQLARLSRQVRRLDGAALGLRSAPEMPLYRQGEDVPLTVRDVVLFDAAVTRVVRALDAEMASHRAGYDVLCTRVRHFTRNKRHLPLDPVKRERRVRRILEWSASAGTRRAGGLRPTAAELGFFEQLILEEHLVV
jgi:hypothetical protein